MVFHGDGLAKRTVSKVTATQVVLNDGSRWLKRGRRVGAGTWAREWATPWDEEEHQKLLREAKLRQLRREVDAQSTSSLTADQCQRILAIYKEAEK